jgi:hypothetical protein
LLFSISEVSQLYAPAADKQRKKGTAVSAISDLTACGRRSVDGALGNVKRKLLFLDNAMYSSRQGPIIFHI